MKQETYKLQTANDIVREHHDTHNHIIILRMVCMEKIDAKTYYFRFSVDWTSTEKGVGNGDERE